MDERRLGFIAGEHAGDLVHARFARNLGKLRFGHIGVVLAHHVVALPHHGDLRQVGHDDDLMRTSKVSQHRCKRAGHGTAHAGIDLIEDEGIHTVGLPQNDFAGKHDARELAARGDAPKRSRRQADTAAVQKLARRRSSLVPALTRQRPRLPNELSVSHLQTRHLFASLAAKAGGGLITALGKHLSRFGERRLCNIDRLLRALDPRLTIAYDGKQLARILAAGKDVFHAGAELSEQSLKR